jgi:hypothetical protein
MGTVNARHLEPVGSDFRRVETVSREFRETELPVFGPSAIGQRRGSLRSEAPEQLQVVAALLWQGWLVAAGSVVGLTVLAVLVRVAVVVLRWAL